MMFSSQRADAGLSVCIIREALWAQQGGCDRVPANLRGIIAAVPDPEGSWEIEFLFMLWIKATQQGCIQENKIKHGQTLFAGI